MAPPNTFSDPLEKWVRRQRVNSIFFVEFRPDTNLVFNRWNAVHPIVGNQLAREAEENKRLELSARTVVGTGSLVQSTDLGDYILTCAHLMAPVFNQVMPITSTQLNQLYHPFMVCGHREQRFLDGLDLQRQFRRGVVDYISCENDLIGIRIPRNLMDGYCGFRHEPQTIATRIPRSLDKVVMISWPRYGRSMTTALGWVSNESRSIPDLGEDNNVFGFPIRLCEVDITSEAGSSGGPLFNGEADTVGVLHGGNGKFSYFIHLDEIRATLTNWAMIPPQAQ